MEVFYRVFTEHWTNPTASLDKPCKPFQGSSGSLPDGNPISRSISLTGDLQHLSDIKGSADHFSPVFLIAAATSQPFPPGLCLSFLPALSLVPVSAFSSRSLPAFAWLLLAAFILAAFCSAMTLVPTSSTWFLLLASPALLMHCSRAWSSSCPTLRLYYRPDPFFTWETETHFGFSNFWTLSTIHLSLFCWVQPWAGLTLNAISASLLGPNYRD